ncbi:hypothetical protein [Streptomyces sp. NPDC006785]|uniref:hypothetical protein n=1 Tax=Streptomyces sp. NPDC006785 TaxID=3155461 RepID=UPI0033F13677
MRTRTTTAALITAGLLLTLSACGEDSDDKGTPPPAYKITKQDTDGNGRTVIVEVDSTKNLDLVFNDVANKLTEEAGYFIQINCSTGGTEHVDNRLANGTKAVGNMGAARTGLDDGKTQFEEVADRNCPAK